MKTARVLLALLIFAILFIFSVYNAQPVALTLFDYQTPQLPLFLVLIFVFFLGFFLSALYCVVKISQLRHQLAREQREKEALQKELENKRGSSIP